MPTRLSFRPYPFLTLACGVTLAALVWLGVWQLQRAEWKRELIADFEAQAEAPSGDWRNAICEPLNSHPGSSGQSVFSPVQAAEVEKRSRSAQPEDGFRVFGRSAGGVVGWRIFRALDVGDCGAGRLLTQTDFLAEAIGDLGAPPSEPVTRYILAPWPEHPAMAGANAPEDNEWYWFDADAMAERIGGDRLNREFILVPFAGIPSYLTRTPPVRHISYAVTWFGLAICLVIVYVLVHAQTGRLAAGQRNKPES